MSKKKLITTVACCIVGSAAVITGIFFLLQSQQPPVNVYSAENLIMSGYYPGGSSTGGYVKTDKMQTVYLSETQQVKDIHVSAGQTVHKGDPLLDFDTSLTDLQLKRKELDVKRTEQQLQNAKKEYNEICNYKPYSPIPVPEPVKPDPSEIEKYLISDRIIVGGSGTIEDPYLCAFVDGLPFETDFITELLSGSDSVWIVFAQCEDNLYNGTVTAAWGTYFSTAASTKPTDPTSPFYPEESSSSTNNVETTDILDSPITISDKNTTVFSFFDASSFVGEKLINNKTDPVPPIEETSSGYTYAEIQQMKANKQLEIRDLDLSLRIAETAYKEMQAEIGGGTLYAEIDGVITNIGNPETAYTMNEPVIKVSGGGGYYIEGAVSELELNSIKIGQSVHIMSWNTGTDYEGKISAISNYPSGNNGWSDGNNNVTFYSFTVFVDGDANLQEYDYVDMELSAGGSEGNDSIYLEKPFIIQENGKSYIYVMGENELLEKREVQTGAELWGSYIEILDGMGAEDQIAFPYGKNVREGAKTKLSTIDELYSY